MLRRFLCAVGAGATRAPAIDYTWSTGTAGNWTDAPRWSPNGVPVAGDNATIAAPGTYTVALAGTRAANNVTRNNTGTTVNAGNFNLGNTLTLAAGTWSGFGFGDNPATFTGGTITRGANGTGQFFVDGTVRFQNTAVQGQALRLNSTNGSLVRMAGTAAFTPGSVVSFTNAMVFAEATGIVWDQNAVVDNVTINTGPGVQVGLAAGTSLTLGTNFTLVHNDVRADSFGQLGRHSAFYNPDQFTLTNRGTVRNVSGLFYIGNATTFAAPSIDVVNSGLIEASRSGTDIRATNFTNQAGGVVRATGGGGSSVSVFADTSLTNQGTFDVGDGCLLSLGGRFLSSGVGTITRTGTNTVGFYNARIDNTNRTFGVSAATGNYVLLGDSFDRGAGIVGGNLSASGGAKLEVGVSLGAYSGFDYNYLTDVSVGPGVLSFPTRGGKLVLRGTSTLAARETITLAGVDTQLAFAQTRQVDNLSVELAANSSSLAALEDNDLTLGPTTTVRKTGTGTGRLVTVTYFTSAGTPSITNLGTVRVEAGTLNAADADFTNRGLVDVAAGATFNPGTLAAGLRTGAGGTVRGSGTVNGGMTFTGANTHLRPGAAAAPGRLTTGNVTMSSGTTLHLRLNGTTAGTTHDQLAVTGTVNLAGATLDLSLGYTPAATDLLFIITNDGTDAVSGAFSGLAEGSTVTVGGYAATIRYGADSASLALSGGNDVALTNFTPVPEPGLMLGVAALGLALWRAKARATSPPAPSPRRRGGDRGPLRPAAGAPATG